MAEVTVRCRGLEKRFGDVVAVADVDLDVRTGSLVALLGPSGCGKTTILRLLAGFERPDAGTIELSGRLVARAGGPFLAPERRRVGIVVQEYALFPHLTVAANVGYGLPGRARARDPRVEAVLELVGLGGLSQRMPHELSGGQQQRVALARALAPQPDVILMDEPFTSLDASLRARVRSEVVGILRAAGATAILVTHDQEEALSVADEVAVMGDGTIHQIGTPQAVYGAPADAYVARFVGDAELVPAQSDGIVLSSALGTLVVSGPVPPAGAATAVVRPESIQLEPAEDGEGIVRGRTFYGHDQIVEIDLGGLALRSRLGPIPAFEAGSRVNVTVRGPVAAFAGPPP